MCKGTACIAEKRHVIDAVVTVNVTEHQVLELPICMLHGDTRRGEFPADVKAAVQYGENLQSLAVALNTVDAVIDRDGNMSWKWMKQAGYQLGNWWML